jgi:hypothetical protein
MARVKCIGEVLPLIGDALPQLATENDSHEYEARLTIENTSEKGLRRGSRGNRAAALAQKLRRNPPWDHMDQLVQEQIRALARLRYRTSHQHSPK